MTCRTFILDFDKKGLFQAADPQTIAQISPLWEKNMQTLGPWDRIRATRLDNTENACLWQPEKSGEGPVVLVCGQCTSTMDAAWHFIENRQFNVWDSVIAVEQTAGRGQQKRQWISPAGNIHASWLWPLPEFDEASGADWSGLLSLMVGFVFTRVFKELNVPVQIKWPNDMLVNNRKFGGILVERRADHILVGTGINVNYSPEDRQLREEFAVPATHLSAQGFEMSPLSLWTTLVEKGKSLFERLTRNTSPVEFIRMIDTQIAWIGKKVLIRRFNTDVFEAVILGLAEDGGLRIKKDGREEVMYSGSILPA
jgi:BirA family transcriptional regulator, biotin operon repressor / biotin---[acetyl-CoA-carboxylase] ligase